MGSSYKEPTMTMVPKRIECVGPKCGVVVSMVTASSEDWIVLQESKHPNDTGKRTHLGWCRKCKDRFQVTEVKK